MAPTETLIATATAFCTSGGQPSVVALLYLNRDYDTFWGVLDGFAPLDAPSWMPAGATAVRGSGMILPR